MLARSSQILLLFSIVVSSALIGGLNPVAADTGSITMEQPEAGSEFDPGDEVTVSGSVEGVTTGKVSISIESGDTGKNIHEKDVNLVDDGSGNGLFEDKFTLPKDGYINDPNYESEGFEVSVLYGDNEGAAFFDVLLDTQVTIELSTDKDTYAPGDEVTVTGTANGADDGDTITIDVTDLNNEKIVDGESATITDEEFTYTFTLPADAEPSEEDGDYGIDVLYKDTIDQSAYFTVEGSAAPTPNKALSVRTDAEEYDAGDQVKVTGTAGGSNGEFVEVTVLGPDNKPINEGDKVNVAIANGNFTYTFSLGNAAADGAYEVLAKFKEESKSSTFRVKGVGVPTVGPPSLQIPVKVGKIKVQTDGEKYEQGDQVQITGTVAGARDNDEVEITVFGPDNKPIDDVDGRRRSINDERFSLSFDISRESDLGIYKVLVKALGDEEDTVFIVEGDGGSTDDPFTLETDREQYSPGDRVEISGKVDGTEDGTDVIISIYDPEGEVLNNVDTKKDNISDEKFTFSFDLPLNSIPGRYKVYVDVDGSTEDTIFAVGGEDSGPQAGISVEMSDHSLSAGETAIVTLTVQGATGGDIIHYTTFGPEGEVGELSGQFTVANETDTRHVFSITLNDERAGGYAVLSTLKDKSASTVFTFEGTGASGSSSSVTTDRLIYDPGDTVEISGNIDGADDGDTVAIVVDDPEDDETPLFSDDVTISEGSFSTQFNLENTAIAGFAYHVHATINGDTFNTIFAVENTDNPTTLDIDDSYDAGSEVTVTGTSDGAEDGTFADIIVMDQDDNTIMEEDVFEITDGGFEFTFNLDSDLSGRGRVEVLAPACCADESVIRVFDIANSDTGGASLPTVETDDSSYEAGGEISVTGSVPGASDGDEVKISIFDPDGNPLEGADEEAADVTSGDFSFDFTLPEDAPDGLYQVKVEAPDGDKVFTYFGIGQDENPVGGVSSFTVTTEQTLYNLGDDVIITGAISGATDGQKVKLSIKKPDEQPDEGSSKKSISQEIQDEEYSYSLSLSERDDEGVYFVEAEFGGNKIHTYFDVEKRNFDIKIETDKLEYDPGDIVELGGTVKGAEDGDKVEITVTTPNGEVVDEVDEFKDKIVDEEFGTQFKLEQGGDIGVYTIRVNYENDKSTEYGYFDVMGERNPPLVRVVTDKNTYAPGDTVQVGGVVTIAEDGNDVDLTVYDPFDNPVPIVSHKKVDVTSQQFIYQFELPNYATEGVYEVHATFFDHADFTKFQVVADLSDYNIGSLVRVAENKLFFDGVAVDFDTNSELSSAKLDSDHKSLVLQINGGEGTEGNMKIGIGKVLRGEYQVLIDGETTDNFVLTGQPDTDEATIELTYPHSNHEITIVGTQVVPEFPMVTLAPLSALVVLVILVMQPRFRSRLGMP